MKRHLNDLLQQARGQFDGAPAAYRVSMPRGSNIDAGLRPEDGYDWLRQIKQVQANRLARHRVRIRG